jgi:hypothetical protein
MVFFIGGIVFKKSKTNIGQLDQGAILDKSILTMFI